MLRNRTGKMYVLLTTIMCIKHGDLNTPFGLGDFYTDDCVFRRVLKAYLCINSLGFLIFIWHLLLADGYWNRHTALEESFFYIYCFLLIFFHGLLHDLKTKHAVQTFLLCMILRIFYFFSENMKTFLRNSQAPTSITRSVPASSLKSTVTSLQRSYI